MDNPPAFFKPEYRFNIYLGTFFIAFSTLALEITLTRLLSVITWYHLAFFAISTAMLGMTAGAVTVYIKTGWFSNSKLCTNIAKVCLGYAVSVFISLILICLVNLNIGISNMKYFALFLITFSCSLPFYFSGIAVSAVLTKFDLPIGKLYASDLIGASLGCLFVLVGLEHIDAPALIILCGAIGVFSVLLFAYKEQNFHLRLLSAAILLFLLMAASVNLFTTNGIRPLVVKGAVENPSQFIYEKWNSFSRVAVFKPVTGNPNWKSSPSMPADSTCIYYWMLIDGDAGTALLSHNKPGDLGMLRYDVTNIGYYLKENSESACIIGMGGGKDVLSALEFGINNVTGIDVNPIFIDLQKNRFRNESKIADLPNVKLITDEARSYLSRSDEKFSLIQMALTDTWASTGAGAFTLTENSLYTLEAWKIILSHLDDSGIFTVSRWYSGNNLGETGRIVSLAAASLLQMGIKEPARHIAMLSMSRLATIIVSKNPFNEKDIAVLKSLSQNLRYETLIIPGETPKNDVLRELISVKSEEELSSVIKDKPLNYSPPTDNDPYFFNMLRLSHLGEASTSEPGVLYGNLTASITLITLIIALVIISVLTIFFPVIYAGKKNKLSFGNKKEFWKGAAYFSLIGAGFMMVEIGFIQRLSVFLGHPVYALGILLFTIILSAGTGSFFSENLRIDSAKWKFILPALAAVIIIIIKFLLDLIIPEMVSSSELVKILAAVAAIFPLGFILGFFFPLGMRSIKPAHKAQTPWYWALNGTFGVLFSALAVFFSIYSGISTNFYLASVFYLSVVFFIKNPEKKI